MLKQILTVPYEKEVTEAVMSNGSKRKFDDSTNEESKKPKTDISSVRDVFVEI